MKKIFSLVLCLCLIIGVVYIPASASEVINVTINGQSLDFTPYGQAPVIQNNRTLVPLRAIFEALGATVEWNDELKLAEAKRGDVKVSLFIGYGKMLVNGIGKDLDVPAQIINDRTMIPARAVAEAFGCSVAWDNLTKTVIIVDGATEGISVCLASEPDTLDPALNASLDGATMIVHLFSGLAKWNSEGTDVLPDCAVSLPDGVKNADGTITYTYTIRDDCYWSDGVRLTAHDFEYSWKRAASNELWADYGYMFDVIKGYPNNLAVEATDDKTLVVTLYNAVPYWNELLAFPTYMPVREDVVADVTWASDPDTFICNGPYKITDWNHDFNIVLEKNPYYHDSSFITMKKIDFYLSDDLYRIYSDFENGKLQMIEFVPMDNLTELKQNSEFYTVSQLGSYYGCWNINVDLLPQSSTLTGIWREMAQAEIRNALSLLLDRTYIVEELTQNGELPANTFVPIGLTDADGSDFAENTNYFDINDVNGNYEKAVEILKKYYSYDDKAGRFTDAPTLTYVYNSDRVHEVIAEYMQAAFASVGITIRIENQEWNTFLNKRNSGEFDIARHGWIADYNDPTTFLDMWTTNSGNNAAQFGKGAHKDVKAYSIDLTPFGYDIVVENGTWAETYDVLIKIIKSCSDKTVRYKLMHLAEDMIMATGCIMPIYYYTDVYMVDDNLKGVYTNPLGYKYFMYSYIIQ